MDLLEFVQTGTVERPPGGDEAFVAFEDWPAEEMAKLRGLGRLEVFEAGQTMIEAGSREDRDIFVVVSGDLEVTQESAGARRTLGHLHSGDLVGEISFIDGEPRSASVRATSRSKALRVRAEDIEQLCETDPKTALRFMKEIARILSFRLRAAQA